jgi:hypothetical protein
MTRRICAAAIALAFLPGGVADAQVRIGGSSDERPRVENRTRRPQPQPSVTGAEPDARAKTAPVWNFRTPDTRSFPPYLWWPFSGYFPTWSVSGVAPQDVFAPVAPEQGAVTGGVQLDIDPRSADVYVDGSYVGVISDFSGYYKHLEVAAGPHLIMIIARDYEPLIIPVMATPGRTLPIRGTLTRAHGR